MGEPSLMGRSVYTGRAVRYGQERDFGRAVVSGLERN